MGDAPAGIALELLQARLKRIEYVLCGHGPVAHGGPITISQTLHELERALDHVVSRSKVSQDMMKLYANNSELFQDASTEEDHLDREISTKLPVILAAASSYPMTASSLTTITDMPIPPAESSSRIIQTTGDVAQLESLQVSQAKEIAELKQRSTAVLQRYYGTDVLRAGEYWADVEARIKILEQTINRSARSRELEAGTV